MNYSQSFHIKEKSYCRLAASTSAEFAQSKRLKKKKDITRISVKLLSFFSIYLHINDKSEQMCQ